MRATTILAVLLLVDAAIYLHLGGVDGLDNKFYYKNGEIPDIRAYIRLLEGLRSRLASGTDAHGIPVTRPPTDIRLEDRFIQVRLENGDGRVITVIMDTVSVYVVGYLVGPTLHYLNLNNADQREALFRAFPNTNYVYSPLNFSGNYDRLPNRQSIRIGHGALNVATENLYYGESRLRPRAMLVIIQMVAEAVRIRHIESLILRHMYNRSNENFIPDSRALSMENRWSNLSQQIQWSDESGAFRGEIEVNSVSNEIVPVRNVQDSWSVAALALLLYQCRPPTRRTPVEAAVADDDDDKQCPVSYGEVKPPTTNIIGVDGQCMSVKDDKYSSGTPVLLWTCIPDQRAQLWTFQKSDSTIRSNGMCLTAYSYETGSYIMIYDCDRAMREATKWTIDDFGTIRNPVSRHVITAVTSVQDQGRTVLEMGEDSKLSTQAWSAGNFTRPIRTYISSRVREMCLQANGANANARVWLADCVIEDEPWQQWALYGDSTIRLYTDPTLCVTSNGHGANFDIIILSECQGLGAQRWTFMADGTILNPYSHLVMDVLHSDVSLQQIILYEPTGTPNQIWLAF